jgi:ankyrin repeat protein
VECIKLLLENGADINARDKEDATPLQHATFNGSYKAMQLLIERGADINTKDKEGSMPIHKAAYQVKTAIRRSYF